MDFLEHFWENWSNDDDEVEVTLHPERRQYKMQERIGLDKWDDKDFVYRFRLTKVAVVRVLQLIEQSLRHTRERSRYIRPVTQLLVTLRFYALGSMQVSIADFAGISVTSVCLILRKVTVVIAQQRPNFINMPRTNEERCAASRRFYEVARFPRVIGAIDCTHIKIQSPGGSDAENFRNRKGWFSVNTQAVCSADMRIINIVARWPGATHDQTILNASNLKIDLDAGVFEDYIIVGDSGYKNTKYLATPLLNPATAVEHLYNESQIRTRNVIERTFGVWKRRFLVLAMGMRVHIETVQGIICACAVLHNIAIDEKVPVVPTNINGFEQMLTDSDMPEIMRNEEHTVRNVREAVLMPYFRQLLVTGYSNE